MYLGTTGALSLFQGNDKIHHYAFTLAEVLITLGIIGIVAAITIPTLMQKYQQKVLKIQFKNKYALLQQQMLYAKNDFGGNFKSYCTQYNSTDRYYKASECRKIFNNYFKVIGTCSYASKPVVTYNKAVNAYVDIGATSSPRYLLSDGSCYDLTVNSFQLGFTFDMNGPDKGPNALGHDIFSFWTDENDYLQPIKMTTSLTDEKLESALASCDVADTSKTSSSSCLSTAEQRGHPCTKNSSQKVMALAVRGTP